MKIFNKRISSFQIIIFGFMLVILIGSSLLMLPISTRGSGGASFIDAFFTATSAVCVTGLITNDTATYWSQFGQTIILILIQIGGMGVVTTATVVTIVSGKKIGLIQRSTIQESISAHQVGGIVRLTGFIVRVAMIIELIGSLIMSPVFCKEFGFWKGLWYSLFHSVSAFCNAGFDLMGAKEPFSSLTYFSSQPLINITLMLLIVIGGIGFSTWDDIKVNKFHLKKYRMQSKVILSITACLIIFPALYFYFYEFAHNSWGLSGAKRWLCSFFQSITLRTAGFNTVDFGLLSDCGIAIMIIFMLIGGSPGSTAGGMKTTTVAVLFSSAFAVFRKKNNASFFGRRINENAVRNAATIFLAYIVLFITGGIIISIIENLPLSTCLFETASAIGTVGLSMGITPDLSLISHLILIALMFFGRVGIMTLVFATFPGNNSNVSRLPEERITVG